VVMLPQVGQGALAVECRADDGPALRALAAVDDQVSHRSLDAERALLRSLAGSCAVPMAGLASPVDGRTAGPTRLLRLDGMLASSDGRVLVRASLLGEEPDELGAALANCLLYECGGESIEGWGTASPAEGAPVAVGAVAAAAGTGAVEAGAGDAPGR
jgi:hydroxymethylbilane synthase